MSKKMGIRLALPEKGVWVHGKENGQNLTIREALQSRNVVLLKTADVGLGNITFKVLKNLTRVPKLPQLKPELDLVIYVDSAFIIFESGDSGESG